MYRVAGIDLETTGLDFQNDHIVELGYSVREFSYGKWHEKAIAQGSFFMWEDDFPDPMPLEAHGIHKISTRILKEFGRSYSSIFADLTQILADTKTNFILAHNGMQFDRPFLGAKGFVTKLPWIDSKIHIEYPKDCKQHSLLYLAAYHGFLNPFPHDALSDVNTTFRITQQYDFEKLVQRAREPWFKVRADVKFEGRELARSRGYQWNQTLKQWEKTLPESEFIKEQKEAPFSVIRLQ